MWVCPCGYTTPGAPQGTPGRETRVKRTQSALGRSRDSTADSREDVVSTSSPEYSGSSILRGNTPVDVTSLSAEWTGMRFLMERRLMMSVPVEVTAPSWVSSVSSESSGSSVSSAWAA